MLKVQLTRESPWLSTMLLCGGTSRLMVTVLGIEGWIHRLRLYRTRKLSSDDAS